MKVFVSLSVIVMVTVSLLSFLPGVMAQGHTMQVRLNINNTSNTVYIPGVGEVPAGSLGSATYPNPEHYYLASYSLNFLTGLVAATGNYIGVATASGYHTLEIDQDVGGRTFLVFSQGDWNNIENQIIPIETEKFLKYASPSFAFGLGTYYPVTVLLRYSGIDIVGNVDQSKGLLRLTIENMGVSGGRPVVEVRKS